MKKTYEEILSIPIDKTKITSVWSEVNDNSNGKWKFVIDNQHRSISFLLSEISNYFELDGVKNVFDVGSLNGIESVYFAQLLPNSNVYSFEANPDSSLLVETNQESYLNAKCINKAVSDYDGNDIFYLATDNIGASSLLKPIGGLAGKRYNEIDVEVIMIETYCKENNIDTVDILWMDLQGNELNALKGMGDILNTTKVICSEIGLRPYYENHQLYGEIWEYLKGFGFIELTIKDPFGYGKTNGYETDMIFINKRLHDKLEKNKGDIKN